IVHVSSGKIFTSESRRLTDDRKSETADGRNWRPRNRLTRNGEGSAVGGRRIPRGGSGRPHGKIHSAGDVEGRRNTAQDHVSDGKQRTVARRIRRLGPSHTS